MHEGTSKRQIRSLGQGRPGRRVRGTGDARGTAASTRGTARDGDLDPGNRERRRPRPGRPGRARLGGPGRRAADLLHGGSDLRPAPDGSDCRKELPGGVSRGARRTGGRAARRSGCGGTRHRGPGAGRHGTGCVDTGAERTRTGIERVGTGATGSRAPRCPRPSPPRASLRHSTRSLDRRPSQPFSSAVSWLPQGIRPGERPPPDTHFPGISRIYGHGGRAGPRCPARPLRSPRPRRTTATARARRWRPTRARRPPRRTPGRRRAGRPAGRPPGTTRRPPARSVR